MQTLAIVGIFYDGYYDIWEDFLELFNKYWPDCPYHLYIVNNAKDLKFEKKYNVTVLHAGENAEYSRKVQLAVNQIDSKYYLLLLEDFFVGEQLDKDILTGVIRSIIADDINYYRMPMNDFIPKRCRGKVCQITPDVEYPISCQPSIWKKDFLKKCIGTENYNAWVFEGIYVKAKKAHTKEFLKGCIVDYRNILCLYHGVLQGRILNHTFRHFIKKGYIFKTKMELISKKDETIDIYKKKMKDYIPLKLQQIYKRHVHNDSIIEKYDFQIQSIIEKMDLN